MLYQKLKNYTLEDAIKIEQQDRQFLALKKLYENKTFSDEIYILLVVINALISFQLSWKGEDYWEEFSKAGLQDNNRITGLKQDYMTKGYLEINGDFGEKKIRIDGDFEEKTKLEEKNNWNYHKKSSLNHLKSLIYTFFEDLLKNGKNNRRFVDMKLKRVEKFLNNNLILDSFNNHRLSCANHRNSWQSQLLPKATNYLWYYKDFCDYVIDLNKIKDYYKNMTQLAEDLAKIMNQQKDAKTIVFAVKMFSYAARNVFWYLEFFPFDLAIPIDSRLENLYKKYVKKDFTKKEIKQYYFDLAKKLNIPPLHLDAILWVNYEKIK